MTTTNPTINKVEIGDKITPFQAIIQDGTTIKSSEVLNEYDYMLLVFYPGDDTPGCTKQLCDIRDIYQEYKDLKVKVLGVNQGSKESHQKFIDKFNYKFDIIVDEDKQLRERFGAVGKFFNNVITKRGVFLINKENKVIYKFWGQQDNKKIIDILKDSR